MERSWACYTSGTHNLATKRLLAAQKLIAGYVFDSLPLVSDEDAGAAHVADAMLVACTADRATCGSYFKGHDPRDVLQSIYREIDGTSNSTKCIAVVREAILNEYVAGTTPSHALRSVVARLVASNDSALVVPALLVRIQQCDNDIKDLQAFFRTAFHDNVKKDIFKKVQLGAQSPTPRLLSDRIVDFAERWEQPTPPNDTLRARVDAALASFGSAYHQLPAFCVFSSDTSAACKPIASTAPTLVYKRDVSATAPLAVGANVLLLASRMNGVSPATATRAATELFSRNATISDRLQRVLALFLSRVAASKPITGEWHVDDVEMLLANPSEAVVAKPVALDSVALAFSAVDKDAAWKFFTSSYLFTRPEKLPDDGSDSFFRSKQFLILLGVVGGIGLLFLLVCWLGNSRYCDDEEPKDWATPAPSPQATASRAPAHTTTAPRAPRPQEKTTAFDLDDRGQEELERRFRDVNYDYRMGEERERRERQDELNHQQLVEDQAATNQRMLDNFQQVNQLADAQRESTRQQTERMMQQYQPTWTPDPLSYSNDFSQPTWTPDLPSHNTNW